MRTLGIDFAAQPKNTAICWIEWSDGRAIVTDARLGMTDSGLITEITKADKAGIDVPLGWPTEFVAAVSNHSEMKPWQQVPMQRLRLRSTDEFVHELTKKWPLSVSTDRIGVAALRAASLVSKLESQATRDGSGKLVEVYPFAALKQWGFDANRYKGKKASEKRCALLQQLLAATKAWLTVGPGEVLACEHSDDVLDALVAALVARASALDLVEKVPEQHKKTAQCEGWIVLPTTMSLSALARHQHSTS